jgi:type IV pilus assembly protein PilP
MDPWMMWSLRQNGWSMGWSRTVIVLLVVASGLAGLACGDARAQAPTAQVGEATPGPAQSAVGQGNTSQPPPIPAPGMDGDTTVSKGSSGGYSYDPSGRRDPFKPIGLEKALGADNPDIPPLQRVGLTELNLIGIMWGGFGYTAMVQTPDGKGYTIKRGTRVGPNNGVVSAITENSIIVKEQYRDVYGKEQVREYVKHLHTKEDSK